MFRGLAVVFVILLFFTLMAAGAYSIMTSKLQSVDKTCGPLKEFGVYKGELTVRDTITGDTQKYQAGNQLFCLYNFNYHSEYWYFGWLAFVFAILALICFIIYMSNKQPEEEGDELPGLAPEKGGN